MKKFIILASILHVNAWIHSQDLVWSTSPIPDNTSALYDFGPTGSPFVNVSLVTSGPGTFSAGPARFTTVQSDITWRSQINFTSSTDLKTFTFTFDQSVCGLSFILYDIDGDNSSGDRAIITADNGGVPQTITAAAIDATPPTVTGSGSVSVQIVGTQGSQSDNRVQISISGCITTLTIRYGNNISGIAGTRSFSIGNLFWPSVQPNLEDLVWNSSTIPDNSTSYSFGAVGSPSSSVNYSVTGPGSFDLGPLRYTTVQGTDSWRTRSTFASVNDLKTYTLTFNPAVCNLSFIIYDIDGNNSNGDRGIVTASYFGTPQNISLTALDASPPTFTGNGTATATATGTQGNQDDNRVRVNINGCVSTLTIQYGNNPAGVAGQRSFSIGNLFWSGNTLPVTFISFTAQKKTGNHVELNWITENESNLLIYEVERSEDGSSFRKIGNVTPLNRNASYSFNDRDNIVGAAFYRIRQVDIDGNTKYSGVVAVRPGSGTGKGISIFPNPSGNTVFITANNGSIISNVKFFDVMGREVLQFRNGGNRFEISSLPKGLYRVKITDNNGDVSTSAFMKQ